VRPYRQKKKERRDPSQKKKNGWWRVAVGIGPEFKFQYRKKKPPVPSKRKTKRLCYFM
jgi:hypothetical protein